MLTAYVKAADIVSPKELFARMIEKNIVSWTTMLRALSDVGDFVGMRSLFNRLKFKELGVVELLGSCRIQAGLGSAEATMGSEL
jgi:pentatricopeptide repeat protein